MITQEPPFVMTLTGSQKTPVLVIESAPSQKIRSSGQLIAGPYQLRCVFKKPGLRMHV